MESVFGYILAIIVVLVTSYPLKGLYTLVTFLRRVLPAIRAAKQFPMEKPHWLYGHLKQHPGATHEGLMMHLEWTKRYPRYYMFLIGPLRASLLLNHPDTVRWMCRTAEPKNFIGGGGYALMRDWIGDGLLLSDGRKWTRNRKLLTPGFHFDVLKPYIGVVNTCVDVLLDKFDAGIDSGRSQEIYAPISLCTLDIILQCAFSTKKPVQTQGARDPYVGTVFRLARAIVDRARNPLLYFDSLYYRTKTGKAFRRDCQFSHRFADEVIQDRKRVLAKQQDVTSSAEDSKRHLDFLDILLMAKDEDGKGMTDLEIRDEVETFMFEGHDTTSSGIAWILYNLARHPEIQTKARQEIDDIIGDRGDDVIGLDDLPKMTFVTQCVKESLRLHPPVYMTGREATRDCELDGKHIPKYSMFDISIWNLHHNPEVWENPMCYNPDRFLPENINSMDPYAFIPFSAGPRNCIGQTFAMHELKIATARLLRRFTFALDASHEVRLLSDIVLRPENGIQVYFIRRL